MPTIISGTSKARSAIPGSVSADPHHSYMGDNSSLRRSYLPDEYRRDTALHNVVATVHIEAECDRSQQVAETRWLAGIAERHGMPNAIVAHAWIDEPNSEEILAQQKQFPLVRGIRTKPIISDGPDKSVRGHPRSMQDPKWRNGPVAAREARPLLGPARGVVASRGGGRGGARASGPAHRPQPHRLSARPLAGGAGGVAPRHGGAGGLPERAAARSRASPSKASPGRSPPTSR